MEYLSATACVNVIKCFYDVVLITRPCMYSCMFVCKIKNQKPPIQLYAGCIFKTEPKDTIIMSAAHMHL